MSSSSIPGIPKFGGGNSPKVIKKRPGGTKGKGNSGSGSGRNKRRPMNVGEVSASAKLSARSTGKKAGLPIQVYARIRPTMVGEVEDDAEFAVVGDDQLMILESGSDRSSQSPMQFEHVLTHNASQRDVYERCVLKVLEAFSRGTNGCVLAMGPTGAGKSFTVEGSSGSRGMIAYAAQQLFQILEEKSGSVGSGNEYDYSVRIQYMELLNEEIQDLLVTSNTDLLLTENTQQGTIVNGLSWHDVDSTDEMLDLVAKGKMSRSNSNTDGGNTREKAASIFVVELEQTSVINGRPSRFVSRLQMVDTPATDILLDSMTGVRQKESATMNKGIISLANIVRKLGRSNRSQDVFVNYRQSKLTALLEDALGGNCITSVICALRRDDAEGSLATAELCQLMRNIRNFPLLNDGTVQAILGKYRTSIKQLREELLMSQEVSAGGNGFGGGNDEQQSAQLMKIHDLEGQIVQENLEKAQLLEEKEQMYRKLVELRDKYNALVESKTDLKSNLIEQEEEKLHVSKALLELQIENTKLQESRETDKYEMVNKLLTAENDLLEMQMKHEGTEKKMEELEKMCEGLVNEKKALAMEFVAVKENLLTMENELEVEKAKNQEVGLELLTLVNAKEQLTRERDSLRNAKDGFSNNSEQMNNEVGRLRESNQKYDKELRKRREEVESLRSQLIKKQLEQEQVLVQFESMKVELERRVVTNMREKDQQMNKVQKDADRQVQDSQAKAETLMMANRNLEREYKQLSRRTQQVEQELQEQTKELQESQNNVEQLEKKTRDLEDRFLQKVDTYVRELVELGKEIGDDGTEAGSVSGGETSREAITLIQNRVESLMKDLVDTYTGKQHELEGTVSALRSKNRQLNKQNKKLSEGYRELRYKVEDMSRRGETPEITNERDFVIGERGSSRDSSSSGQQQQQLIESLEDQVRELTEQVQRQQFEHLMAAETHQKMVVELKAKNSALKREIEQTRDIHKSMTEGAGVRESQEMQRLQQQNEKLMKSITKKSGISQKQADKLQERIEALQEENLRLKQRTYQDKYSPKGGDTKLVAQLRTQITNLEKELDGKGDSLSKQLRDFTRDTQQDLEKERSELLARATMAEEQLDLIQEQMRKTVARYQKEIIRLRTELVKAKG